MDVHEVVQQVKGAADGAQGVVDSAVAAFDAFCDRLDAAFTNGSLNDAKAAVDAVRQHKHEIAQSIAS